MKKLRVTIPIVNIVISEVSRRTFLSIVSALAVSLGTFSTALAQSDPSHPMPALVTASEDNWTVLTMAPDGSWGVATNISSNQAITRAIADCKMMSQAKIGCGAQFTTIRAGWSLGIRCGDQNIMAAGKTLAAAEKAAIKRRSNSSGLLTRYAVVHAWLLSIARCGRRPAQKPDGIANGSASGFIRMMIFVMRLVGRFRLRNRK
jgi:hypothetical protein